MKDDEAFRQLIAHAGYVYPNLFVDCYIKNINYRMLELKDFHIQILNVIKPGEYGKQINIQAPRGTGKTTFVNRLIPTGAPDAVRGACRSRIMPTAQQRLNRTVARKQRQLIVRL